VTTLLPGPSNSEYAPPVMTVSSPGGAVTVPEQWRDRLVAELAARWSRVAIYDRYYEGEQSLMFASDKFRSTFGRRIAHLRDNWCPLVVDAVEERMTVQGFRFGDDPAADKDAWEIWQANDLDSYSQVAHTESLIAGESYALVAPGPVITIEHASQMIVACSKSNRRIRLAALKQWVDDSGYVNATLYLPDEIYKWRSDTKNPQTTRWVVREVPGETWPILNPAGVVPVVPLSNRARLLGGGRSELHDVLPLQDAANKLLADMLVAAEYAAFRQRWVVGLDIETDAATNQPKAPFNAAVDRVWQAEDPNARFGEFSESQLSNYVVGIEKVIQHIATITRTPPHYFYLGGNFPSGESIKSAEVGLVAKAKRKMRHFGEAWEDALRVAFRMTGDPRAFAVTAETIWADPEYRTEGEHIDALLKQKALEVPKEVLWEKAGYSPQEITRFASFPAPEPVVPMPPGATPEG
jgi:hypothetical protein